MGGNSADWRSNHRGTYHRFSSPKSVNLAPISSTSLGLLCQTKPQSGGYFLKYRSWGTKTDSITFEEEDIAYIGAAEKIVQDNRIVPVEVLVSGAEGVAPVARKIVEYFVRPLHDYNHIFHSYEARLQTLAFSDDNARYDITATTAARNDAVGQIEYRKQEKKELELDLELHRRDEYEAELYSATLQSEVAKLTSSLAEIFDRNRALAQTLADRQSQLEEAIDARTQEAENATGNSEE